jgi:formate dehydrogenase maturation protein FdhE
MMRVLEAITYWLSLRSSPRTAVLEVALELQRLDQRLFEIGESVALPVDVSKMRQDRVPRTVAAELYAIVEMVREEPLAAAIADLQKVAQATEEELRAEFFERHGGGV